MSQFILAYLILSTTSLLFFTTPVLSPSILYSSERDERDGDRSLRSSSRTGAFESLVSVLKAQIFDIADDDKSKNPQKVSECNDKKFSFEYME